jgi:rod shape-determining protein MreC
MNFRQRNNDFERKSGKNKFVLAGFIVLIFIIIFSFQGPRNILFGIGGPFWGVKNSIANFFSDNIQLLKSKSALIADNNLLKQEIQNDKENQLLSSALKNENDDLKNILGRKNNNQKEILSAILAKPTFSPYDTLVIDVGSADGVSVGDEVLALGDSYIGYISEVYDNSSKVVLYSSSGETINVLIGSDKIEKTATGMGGGNFSLKAPADSGIKIGDPIIVPSISSNIFSAVEKIESKPTDSFETILFKNPVNISELEYVEVLPSVKIK